MGRLTTHVLDTASGKPAAGLKIELFRQGDATPLKTIHTNADGRADGPILEGADFAAGQYELRFHAGDYLRASGVDTARARLSSTWSRSASASRSGRALSRAAAALALWLFDLPGELTAVTTRAAIRFLRRGKVVELTRRAADARRCSTSCASTSARAAPRKAATRAIAAPARWCSGALQRRRAGLRARQRLHPAARPARRHGTGHRRGSGRRRGGCTRCSRRWSDTTARNAASARPASS